MVKKKKKKLSHVIHGFLTLYIYIYIYTHIITLLCVCQLINIRIPYSILRFFLNMESISPIIGKYEILTIYPVGPITECQIFLKRQVISNSQIDVLNHKQNNHHSISLTIEQTQIFSTSF